MKALSLGTIALKSNSDTEREQAVLTQDPLIATSHPNDVPNALQDRARPDTPDPQTPLTGANLQALQFGVRGVAVTIASFERIHIRILNQDLVSPTRQRASVRADLCSSLEPWADGIDVDRLLEVWREQRCSCAMP